jgi:hypothetical protein
MANNAIPAIRPMLAKSSESRFENMIRILKS